MADDRVRAELAPNGPLQVGLNHGNFLLVLGDGADGDPRGIAPDIARELGRRLGVEITFTRFEHPGALADALRDGAVDLGFLGVEPERASQIDFADAYLEIEACYMVAADAPIETVADVDRPGVRVAVVGRSAYDLWLSRHIRHAGLMRVDSLEASYQLLREKQADVVAGLKQGLIAELERQPEARLIAESFTAVRQSIGIPKDREAALAWLNRFVAEIKASAFVAESIRTHDVGGVRVAS